MKFVGLFGKVECLIGLLWKVIARFSLFGIVTRSSVGIIKVVALLRGLA